MQRAAHRCSGWRWLRMGPLLRNRAMQRRGCACVLRGAPAPASETPCLTTLTRADLAWRGRRTCDGPVSSLWSGHARVTLSPVRALHSTHRATTPGERPWWMPIFESADTRSAAPSPSEPLPPWPIDEIEFNARLADGGHGQRIAHALQQQEVKQSQEADEGALRPMPSSPPPLTDAQRAAVEAAAATEEGRNALAVGGWSCAHCLAAMPYRSRSVCDHCHTLRHDMATTVQGWRTDVANWLCALCHEVNFPRNGVCRCCATPRSATSEVRVVHHERVADEVRHAKAGAVVNVRNRICRWQCPSCAEVNSLQCSTCRQCRHERFGFHVSCPACAHAQRLDNARLFGAEAADECHVLKPFGTHNFFPRLAPTQSCDHCGGVLHGASVTSLARPAWLCGCGNVNAAPNASCVRCRLPRAVPGVATLAALCGRHERTSGTTTPGTWDFEGSTNWLCYTCDAVNRASRYVVGPGPPRHPSSPPKAARTVHGDVRCRACQTPWHHQRLQSGECWRCACHMINRRGDAACVVCGLPASDEIRADVLSWWTRGDWVCADCGRHNYRDRVGCSCGAVRPKR